MKYIENISLPSGDTESNHFDSYSPTYYKSCYPFKVLSSHGLEKVDCSEITVICGGNGSGKSTLLNVIAEKLALKRHSPFNHTDLFDEYLDYCKVRLTPECYNLPVDVSSYGRIIASDEVFDFMLDTRVSNNEIDSRRKGMVSQYENMKHGGMPGYIDCGDAASVSAYRNYRDARRKTRSRYIKENLGFNLDEMSNGENGFKYFTEAIQPFGVYLLDEPENSLSAERQIDLGNFISSMARFENCQFIIATHSPFLMAIKHARLYNLDANPAAVMPWTEVESVRTWHDFFAAHEDEFKGPPTEGFQN